MSIVGKQFPDLSVNAINEMGDTISVNVLEEAKNNKKKVLLSFGEDRLSRFLRKILPAC